MNNLLNAVNMGVIGETALQALIGFLVVFTGIALLITVVWLVGKILGNKQGGEKAHEKEPIMPTKTVIRQDDEIDEETLAVITAAIMAYYEQQGNRCEFIVKRIKTIKRY